MQLQAEILTVHTRHPFIIARGGTSEFQVVWVRLRDAQSADDGLEGWGEAAPSRFYGETADTVMAALTRYSAVLERADGWSIDAIERELEKALRWNAAARCAISAALHDLAGKRLNVPLWKLWGLDGRATPRSSFTIGIAPDDETLRARVREALQRTVQAAGELSGERAKRLAQVEALFGARLPAAAPRKAVPMAESKTATKAVRQTVRKPARKAVRKSA